MKIQQAMDILCLVCFLTASISAIAAAFNRTEPRFR